MILLLIMILAIIMIFVILIFNINDSYDDIATATLCKSFGSSLIQHKWLDGLRVSTVSK